MTILERFDWELAERARYAPPQGGDPQAERLLRQLEAMRREKRRLESELEETGALIEETEAELSELGCCV